MTTILEMAGLQLATNSAKQSSQNHSMSLGLTKACISLRDLGDGVEWEPLQLFKLSDHDKIKRLTMKASVVSIANDQFNMT